MIDKVDVMNNYSEVLNEVAEYNGISKQEFKERYECFYNALSYVLNNAKTTNVLNEKEKSYFFGYKAGYRGATLENKGDAIIKLKTDLMEKISPIGKSDGEMIYGISQYDLENVFNEWLTLEG